MRGSYRCIGFIDCVNDLLYANDIWLMFMGPHLCLNEYFIDYIIKAMWLVSQNLRNGQTYSKEREKDHKSFYFNYFRLLCKSYSHDGAWGPGQTVEASSRRQLTSIVWAAGQTFHYTADHLKCRHTSLVRQSSVVLPDEGNIYHFLYIHIYFFQLRL